MQNTPLIRWYTVAILNCTPFVRQDEIYHLTDGGLYMPKGIPIKDIHKNSKLFIEAM